VSAPLYFQSAGRGDLKFWGEDDGPIVVVWKVYRNLSRSGSRERWASQRIGGFGAGREKKTKSNARLKPTKMKSSQTTVSKQKPTQEKGWIRKKAKGSQCAGKRGGDRATSNAQWAKSMLRVRFTKIAIMMRQTSKSDLKESGWSIRREKRMSSAIERESLRMRLLDGHRDRHVWRLRVSGPSLVMVGDGSDKRGNMGAGYNNLRRKRKSSSAK